VGGDFLIGEKRVRHAEEREFPWRLAAPLFVYHRADRAAPRRLLDEKVPVKPLTAQGDKKFSRSHGARIGIQIADDFLARPILPNDSRKARDLID
jgi:hypothetical protein